MRLQRLVLRLFAGLILLISFGLFGVAAATADPPNQGADQPSNTSDGAGGADDPNHSGSGFPSMHSPRRDSTDTDTEPVGQGQSSGSAQAGSGQPISLDVTAVNDPPDTSAQSSDLLRQGRTHSAQTVTVDRSTKRAHGNRTEPRFGSRRLAGSTLAWTNTRLPSALSVMGRADSRADDVQSSTMRDTPPPLHGSTATHETGADPALVSAPPSIASAAATDAAGDKPDVIPTPPLVPVTPLVPVVPAVPLGQTGSAGTTARVESLRDGRRSSQMEAGQLPKDPNRASAFVTQFGNATVASTAEFAQDARPAVGLSADIGAIVVSLVNNVAIKIATAFGPDAFFGMPFSIATSVATTAANVSKVLTNTPLDAVSNGPFPVNLGVYDVLANLHAAQPPAGANDPTIKVTDEHPLPILLLHGSTANQNFNWSVGAPLLANAGYKVYTFNYGNTSDDPNNPSQGVADIHQSGQELAVEVQKILDETGAPKVILIGHSQGGGIMPIYYINELGGDQYVSQLIGIAPSNHGTYLDGIVPLVGGLPIVGPLFYAAIGAIGPAMVQQLITSPFQEEVYGMGDTRDGVLYTTITTRNDWAVTPYTQQALVPNNPSVDNVHNIVLQDLDHRFFGGHGNVGISSVVWDIVLAELAANPVANVPVNTAIAA